jgi:hypothetical protein
MISGRLMGNRSNDVRGEFQAYISKLLGINATKDAIVDNVSDSETSFFQQRMGQTQEEQPDLDKILKESH